MKTYKIGLKHGVGNPSIPVVNVGDTVKSGSMIARADGLGSNIFSSVGGTVKLISDNSIHIIGEPSNEYEKIDETLTPLAAIEAAGVVGCGGAGFPTHIKLSKKIEGGRIYINAAECEPLLKHNIEYINKSLEEFIEGIKIVSEILGTNDVVIAIKSKHFDTIEMLEQRLKDESISVGILDDNYPAGDERVIVRELHKVLLKPGELPLNHNLVVINVETVKNIYNAVVNRKPVITKDLTIGGKIEGCDTSVVCFDVPIGSTIEDAIKLVGNFKKPFGEILLGGPFTGEHAQLGDGITKTSGGIYVTECFPNIEEKFGIINCDCGASPSRMEYLVKRMGGEVIASKNCKRMVEVNGKFRCEKPGECPGQAEVCLALKKSGATAIIMSTCED